MIKNTLFSFAASALVISALSTHTFAVYEDELCDVITKSLTHKSKDTSGKAEEPESVEPSYWDYLTPISSKIGSLLRTGGAYIRDNGTISEIVTDHAVDSLKGTSYGGISSEKIFERVESKEGTLDTVRMNFGNMMRWAGSCFQEESKTLARDLRKFWVNEKKFVAKTKPHDAEDPNIGLAFSSTATALVMNMKDLSGPDGVVLEYLNFVHSWNNCSYTEHEKRIEYIHQHFVTGLIHALARTKHEFKEYKDFETFLLAFKFDLGNLVLTKGITAETVVPKKEERNEMSGTALEEAVNKARVVKFMDFASKEIQIERVKLKVGKSAKEMFLPLEESKPLLAIMDKEEESEEHKGE